MDESGIKERIYELCEAGLYVDELSDLMNPYKNGSIGIAQINPIVGNLEYNAKKIVKYIRNAQNIGLDLVAFPEMVLVGYPLGDILERYPNIVDENTKWIKGIAKETKETAAIVGFIELKDGKYSSAAAILQNGEIKKIIRKSGTNNSLVILNGKKYQVLIGDIQRENNTEIDTSVDVIINCAASVSIAKYNQLKSQILCQNAKKYSTPIVYVNQVGCVDNFSFDGSSRVYDKDGELLACAESYSEQFMITNPKKGLGKVYSNPIIKQTESTQNFSLDYEYDMERTYKTLIRGIKDYFEKNGFKRAVLGLSGGLDSTVCAVLLADALGAENVLGISLPSKITSETSKSDAQALAQNLGINFTTVPIKEVVDTIDNNLQNLFKTVGICWEGRYKQSYTMDNIQARSRAIILWGVSNEFDSCLPIATSDKSEAYMGYATVNGDMSGGFAPIADVTKTKLFALARWLNKNREEKNAIPESIIQKRPGAELAIDPNTGKPLCAEDALMPYEFMDEVIYRIENLKENCNDMLNSEFLYEKNHKITKEQKVQWLDKFYKRMNGAFYKGTIMPPYTNVDSDISQKVEYKKPIITSKMNYKGHSEEEIREILGR